MVDVDVETGEMNNTPDRQAEIERCATDIAKRLPPFKAREVPPEYRAKNVPPAPILVLPDEEQIEPAPPEEL
jgi:hypothetical protein